MSVCYGEYRRTFSKPNEATRFHNEQISIVVGLKDERQLKININILIYIYIYMSIYFLQKYVSS